VRLPLVALALIGASLASGSCQIPQDPGETLEQVRGGTMRVGVSEHDPWVKLEEGREPGGVEAELVKRFARELDARIDWTTDTESELIDALHERQLDLVIAGLHTKLHWEKEVAFTRPYYTVQSVIGVPPGYEVRYDVEGLTVQAEANTALPGLVERKTDANAEPVSRLEPGRPTGAEQYLLDDLGLEATHVDLDKEKRVMATQLGENAFLVELEHFLLDNEELIRDLLAEEGRP
jgi:polar amino acid transport system substrate-binding protein